MNSRLFFGFLLISIVAIGHQVDARKTTVESEEDSESEESSEDEPSIETNTTYTVQTSSSGRRRRASSPGVKMGGNLEVGLPMMPRGGILGGLLG